jgi:hypothetical protein
MVIWYILGPFGMFLFSLVYFVCHLVHVFPFWYVVPRKIWQQYIYMATIHTYGNLAIWEYVWQYGKNMTIIYCPSVRTATNHWSTSGPSFWRRRGWPSRDRFDETPFRPKTFKNIFLSPNLPHGGIQRCGFLFYARSRAPTNVGTGCSGTPSSDSILDTSIEILSCKCIIQGISPSILFSIDYTIFLEVAYKLIWVVWTSLFICLVF